MMNIGGHADYFGSRAVVKLDFLLTARFDMIHSGVKGCFTALKRYCPVPVEVQPCGTSPSAAGWNPLHSSVPTHTRSGF